MRVYLIENKMNGKRYVGITTDTLENRFTTHKSAARTGSELHLHRAIRKHGEENFSINLLEECADVETMKTRETFWIDELGTLQILGKGYNMTRGGDGVFGYRHTDDARRRMSENRSGEKNHNFGKAWGRKGTLSEKAKQKISEKLTGRKIHNDDSKRKIGEATAIRKRKSVSAFDKMGNFVATYASLREGAEAVHGNANKISECLCGHRKTHKGYVWKYETLNSQVGEGVEV